MDGSSTWMLKSSQIVKGIKRDSEPENIFFDKWKEQKYERVHQWEGANVIQSNAKAWKTRRLSHKGKEIIKAALKITSQCWGICDMGEWLIFS